MKFESQSLSYKQDTELTILCHVNQDCALFFYLHRFNIQVFFKLICLSFYSF